MDIYVKQCRSIVELAAPVWTAGLTKEDITALERVQKIACSIILGSNYVSYDEALTELNMTSLETRREELCIKFVKKAVKNKKYQHWFVDLETPGISTRSNKRSISYKPVTFRTDRF